MAHAVVLEIDGVAYDDKTLEGVQIAYGRQSVDDQPEPTTMSATLLRESTLGTVDVANVRVGASVRLEVTPTGEPAVRRFYGIITDVTVDKWTVQFSATANGIYAMRQLEIAGAEYPTIYGLEYDTYVTSAIFYLKALQDLGIPDPDDKPDTFPDYYSDATVFPDVSLSFDSNVPIKIRDVLSDCVEATPYGVLWEQMDVYNAKENIRVVLAGADSRDQSLASPNLTLTADEIADDWSATRDLGLYCTVAGIDYSGPWTIELDTPPDDLAFRYYSRGAVTYVANVTTTWGTYSTQLDTKLINEADAEALAKYLTDIGVVPGYVCDMTVPLATFTEARQTAIVGALNVGQLWETPLLATGLPTSWFLEGYDETISRNDWTVRVRLSDVRNSWVGQPWQDVTPTLQWDQVGATTTWLDLQGMEL